MSFDGYKKGKPVREDKIVEVKMGPDNESISALILPPGQIWSSFVKLTKQSDNCGQRVLFKRTSALYSKIFTKTIDALGKNKACVWLGHPGIGKSVSTSFVLMGLIKKLGEKNFQRRDVV
jgi:short-subunit dehydrogenase